MKRFASILLFNLIVLGLSIRIGAQPFYATDVSQGGWGVAPAVPEFGYFFSAEAWVYLKNDAQTEQIILHSDDPAGEYMIRVDDGRIYAWLRDQDVVIFLQGTTPLPLGAWAHVALESDNSGFRLFVNGKFEDNWPFGGMYLVAPGEIHVGNNQLPAFDGMIDEMRLSDTTRYDSAFNPFNIPLVNLRVADQEIPGWALGTNPWDLIEAWDYATLYAIIDGGAEIYISHNFQYALRQFYYGQIGGHDVILSLMLFDQGTPADAEALYHDSLLVPPLSMALDSIGEEARVDTSLLFDYLLDFWRDKYYARITLSKEFGANAALQTVMGFAAETDTNILYRYHFEPDARTAALWHFDEGSGFTFYDASGNGRDGMLHNPAWVETAPYQELIYLTGVRILEGSAQIQEIDDDDTAQVAFSLPVAPLEISAANIDDVLPLSSGHSWLSGGELGWAEWDADRDTLLIGFSLAGGPPTIAANDTVRPNPQYLFSAADSLTSGGYRFVRFDYVSGANTSHPAPLPMSPELHVPYPSPFNSASRIVFSLPRPGAIALYLYDATGRLLGTLAQGPYQAGSHEVIWQARDYPSGIYFIILEIDGRRLAQKVALLK
jgi:hypothetical protein